MKITDHVHALKIPFTIDDPEGRKISRFVYSYLICGRDICLIDSGVAGSEKIIMDYLKGIGRNSGDITWLILTHSHPDHIGAAAAIKSLSGCYVLSHAAERSWIEDISIQARARPVPGFSSLVSGSVRVDQTVEDGDILPLNDGLDLEVLHTPGHSAGSISLWLAKEGVLFSADAIPIKGDMPIYQDFSSSIRSIRKLSSIPRTKRLLAAWDEPRDGVEAYRIMQDGLLYLGRIQASVLKLAHENPELNSMQLCRLVLIDLGLPEIMANPLVASSFQASLKARDESK